MPKISTVIITFNEAQNIRKCIESAIEVSDEILVVDSYSSDDTLSICQSLEARVIQNRFEGHVQQKNFAVREAEFDHILSLDADEALSNEARAQVLEVKKHWGFDAYSFRRLNNYMGKWIKHSGWYPDRKIRLFDRTRAQWEGNNPHDFIKLKAGATWKEFDADIYHFPFRSLDHHLGKINSYSSIAATKIVHKSSVYLLSKLILDPPFHFLRNYLLKLGFLDGVRGFIICTLSGYMRFAKYAKALSLQKRNTDD